VHQVGNKNKFIAWLVFGYPFVAEIRKERLGLRVISGNHK
jgi:hypothetical protein